MKLNLNQQKNHHLIDLNESLMKKVIQYIKRDYIFYNFVSITEVEDLLNKYAIYTK